MVFLLQLRQVIIKVSINLTDNDPTLLSVLQVFGPTRSLFAPNHLQSRCNLHLPCLCRPTLSDLVPEIPYLTCWCRKGGHKSLHPTLSPTSCLFLVLCQKRTHKKTMGTAKLFETQVSDSKPCSTYYTISVYPQLEYTMLILNLTHMRG